MNTLNNIIKKTIPEGMTLTLDDCNQYLDGQDLDAIISKWNIALSPSNALFSRVLSKKYGHLIPERRGWYTHFSFSSSSFVGFDLVSVGINHEDVESVAVSILPEEKGEFAKQTKALYDYTLFYATQGNITKREWLFGIKNEERLLPVPQAWYCDQCLSPNAVWRSGKLQLCTNCVQPTSIYDVIEKNRFPLYDHINVYGDGITQAAIDILLKADALIHGYPDRAVIHVPFGTNIERLGLKTERHKIYVGGKEYPLEGPYITITEDKYPARTVPPLFAW